MTSAPSIPSTGPATADANVSALPPNLDLTLVCEAPRIAPHVAAMRERIATTCGIAASRVAIKATTSEQLGFTGRGEGIVAMASAAIELPRGD